MRFKWDTVQDNDDQYVLTGHELVKIREKIETLEQRNLELCADLTEYLSRPVLGIVAGTSQPIRPATCGPVNVDGDGREVQG